MIGLIYELLGWSSIILEIAGLVICIRYLRLSTSMPLLVLAFAGLAGAGFIVRSLGVLPQNLRTGVSIVTYMINVAGIGALVLGLLLVFRDMRERFQFLREVHETTRERTSADSSPNH
jgi:hypothetical protein